MEVPVPEPFNGRRDRPGSFKRSTLAFDKLLDHGLKRSKVCFPRAGSVESDCTQLKAEGAGVVEASLRAANAAGARVAARSHDGAKPADAAWGSAESQRSILHASHVLCSGGTRYDGQQQQQPRVEIASVLTLEFASELEDANNCMKRLLLPDNVPFTPLHGSCVLLPLLEWFQCPPAAVALGASYFQRLMASCSGLAADTAAAGFFSHQPGKGGRLEAVMHGRPGNAALLSVLCTCVYLGLKVCEGPKYSHQLSNMLSHVYGSSVSSAEAQELELQCLKELGWRLGPYCCSPANTC